MRYIQIYVRAHIFGICRYLQEKLGHGKHERVMSHGNESRHINVCTCTHTKDVYEFAYARNKVMAHMSESYDMEMSRVTSTYVCAHARRMCIVLVYSTCTRKECAMAQMSESCHMNVCMCTHTKDVYVFAHAWSLCSHLQRTSHVASEWVIEPCDIWMGCRGQDGRWRHMNASNHVGMGHVTYKRVMSCRNESCPRWISDATDEWVVSEAWSWYL